MHARLDMIGLVVQDMPRALAFYRRLGLDLPAAADQERHVETTLPGGLRIAWDTVENVRSYDPQWEAPRGSARVGLAFLLDGPSDVDRAFDTLVSAGYQGHKEPWDAPWGQRYAVIHDPDGNSVDLFAPLS